MATRDPAPIPWPLSSFPGSSSQESSGRLVNCYAEPLGDQDRPTGPNTAVWRRAPGLSQYTATTQTGYRGGLIVNNLSYEVFKNNVSTVDGGGIVATIGAMPGTKKVSIARDQANPPDVVAVDLDNGAYVLTGVGAPAAYNGSGVLPQPNSVSFQDGYFFYTIADGRVFASAINSVGAINALTFITCQAKSDVTLLRGIAFAGVMFFFTTGSCEVWADNANVAPSFPYNRLMVLEKGLVQSNAVAGFETGFSELCWVAQDYGVYWSTPSNPFAPIKVSPPDLEKLIEAQVKANMTLEASCYAFAGKKKWVLSSPAWTWEFDITSQKWNERTSLAATGLQGRWRATGGHPAFGFWLMGDELSGNLLYIDSTNYTENGAPQLFRMESGPVDDFPSNIRVARADFDFVGGVGIATGATPNIVAPVVAISLSKDGGYNWGNPLVRSLGLQGKSRRLRIAVKNMGMTGPMGARWRMDISDPCYSAFLKATMSSNPREGD